jgi:hypothetical protein
MHDDEHFLHETARGVGQHFEGTPLFATETTHRGCGRLPASDTGHVTITRSTTQGPSGIPWTKTWPTMRYRGSVAIRTLLAVSGEVIAATAEIELFGVLSAVIRPDR